MSLKKKHDVKECEYHAILGTKIKVDLDRCLCNNPTLGDQKCLNGTQKCGKIKTWPGNKQVASELYDRATAPSSVGNAYVVLSATPSSPILVHLPIASESSNCVQ